MAGRNLGFNPAGEFTIVQFTDLHWSSGGALDLRTQALMEEVMRSERPDLVVFTGDVIYGNYSADPKLSFLQAVSCVELAEIPWAAVFGNHDAEKGITRQELMEVMQTCKFCLSEAGPTNISGVGNFIIPVHNRQGNPAAMLYFLDSGSNAPPAPVEGYDWIRHNQINWYVENSINFSAEHGGPLPSLAFFHIPLPEYKQVWNEHTCYGVKNEEFDPMKVNSGFGAAMLEQGDIMGTFAGHDHINDFCGDWHGIRLCYGRGTGYNAYGKVGFSRGARIIRLRENARGFETWLRLEGNIVELEQPVHRPETASSDGVKPSQSMAGTGSEILADQLLQYQRVLEEEPLWKVSKELAELASRLSPELHLVGSEPFALRDCVVVIHPEKPMIAYHLFWEDDWSTPHFAADHQIIWVGYHPETKELTGIWSYFHENIVSSTAAMAEAHKYKNRPQAYVQWGIHGTFLTECLNEVTVSRLEKGIFITNTGMDAMQWMYKEAKRGTKRGRYPIGQRSPQCFTGNFSDYMRFSTKLDTRMHMARPNRVHRSRWANAVINQRALSYSAAPLIEWPDEIRKGGTNTNEFI